MTTERKPLVCTIKAPHLIRVGEHPADFHTGCSVIDVTFPNTFYVEVQEIHFKNFYTAEVSILAKIKETQLEGTTGGTLKWRSVVKRLQLMPHPHSEQGSEDYLTISPKQMAIPLLNLTALRFVLRQPSPIWKDFRIEDLKLFKSTSQVPVEVHLPAWLSDTNKEDEAGDRQLKGVPSTASLSRDMQTLWALTEKARQNQTTASLGRYDAYGIVSKRDEEEQRGHRERCSMFSLERKHSKTVHDSNDVL